MAAAFMGQEKFAITGKDAIIIANVVIIIVTVEGKIKLIKAEALSVLCISFCFFELADHSVVHGKSLLIWIEI